VVAVTEIDQNELSQVINIELISRGFVFDRQNASLLADASQMVKQSISSKKGKIESERQLRQIIIDTLERYLFAKTHRRPMILR
jgi:ribonuclease J